MYDDIYSSPNKDWLADDANSKWIGPQAGNGSTAASVTFTYTQDLSQSNSELIRVEWAVNSRWSAVATRDENGIFGLDFFYKRQFR